MRIEFDGGFDTSEQGIFLYVNGTYINWHMSVIDNENILTYLGVDTYTADFQIEEDMKHMLLYSYQRIYL